ncbi:MULTISPECIES: DUF2911 domain-containing protein [unclassified Sphingobacterium]|uniref:DUF2911 domain-containing protein n=1 Tax=unclassified Sphingobacterium TaxID=2609468 RepID=UPI00265D1BD1|nr:MULTISPECIES: DUF2911 domain-containing protein [unclassified Sphingobacterium]WKK58920.1 DUF2911 domain-containing protein [Sphingobacterium sp. BN32]
MKKIALTLLLASGLIFSAQQADAQIKLPPASSTQFILQDLGISQVSVVYQRPNMKGRKIFGDLVPYDQIWRTGANNATNITFQSDVKIEGQALEAGTYALFTLPGKEEWTIIFNKNAKQWGAYTYDKADDVLRVKVKPRALTNPIETFTIAFEEVNDQNLKACLLWEKTKVSFLIEVDQKAEILASIDEAMRGEKKPYFQAAQYYYTHGLDIKKAAEWMVEADKGNSKAPHIKYWKSLILAKAGDKKGAIKAAEEGLKMAKSQNNGEYVKLNTQALEAAKK